MSDTCDHDWSYVEVRNETWNRCSKCGLGELWAAGNLISSTDWKESDGIHTIPVPRGWSPEQAWEAIKRDDDLTDKRPRWANVRIENGRFVELVDA